MPITANIVPTAGTDGIVYATNVPLTSTEAALGDGLLTPALIPTTFNQAVVAVVQLSINGYITANSSYVVMQMDVGDGVWVDMCWCFWDGRQGSAVFVMSNGIAGANVFQQSRQTGQVPVNTSNVQGNGSNQMTLGGRIRFVGKAVMVGGSSSVSGITTAVKATITYRLQPLR